MPKRPLDIVIARPAKGMSLVEMMISITLGLIIIAAAIIISISQISEHRRLLLETQVQQDLRVTLDLIVRDLRQAGYWAASPQTVNPSSTEISAVLSNPYAAVASEDADGSESIEFSFSRDEIKRNRSYFENNSQEQDERTGFRRQESSQGVGVLQMNINDAWHALTDPAVTNVTRFSVRIRSEETNLPKGSNTENWPPRGPGGGLLKLCQRTATIEIEAESTHDANVRRSIGTDVRLRNNLIREGNCA
jgi:type IV pilus assembly protein PilW